MLYITTSHPSLVYYHVCNIQDKVIDVYSNPKNLNSIISNGTYIDRKVQVVILDKVEIEPLEWSKFNTIYLCLPKLSPSNYKYIRDIEGIKLITIDPSLYKSKLQQFKGIFTTEAFDWFWDKFNNFPVKLNGELYLLIDGMRDRKGLYSIDDLKIKYSSSSSNLIRDYLNCVGNREGTNLLKQMKSSEMWPLFIGGGSREPLIKCKFNEELKYYLEYVKLVIKLERIDSRLAFILFNVWLEEIGINKLNNVYGPKSRISKEQRDKLEKLL